MDAAGSEDLDTLAFGSPVLLRHLSLADKKKAIVEFRLDRALESLDMDMDQVRLQSFFKLDRESLR